MERHRGRKGFSFWFWCAHQEGPAVFGFSSIRLLRCEGIWQPRAPAASPVPSSQKYPDSRSFLSTSLRRFCCGVPLMGQLPVDTFPSTWELISYMLQWAVFQQVLSERHHSDFSVTLESWLCPLQQGLNPSPGLGGRGLFLGITSASYSGLFCIL